MKIFYFVFLLFPISHLALAMTNQEVVETINSGSQFKQYSLHAAKTKTTQNKPILWKPLKGPSMASMGSVKIVQMKNNTSILFASSAKQIFRSLDSGKSWKLLSTPQGIAVNDLDSVDDHKLILTNENGVFLSDDFGDHWYASSNGISGRPSDVHVVNQQLIFLITNKLAPFSNIYRSIDGGKSWTPASLGLDTGQAIWSLASRDNIVLVSAYGLNISTNKDAIWTQPSTNWKDWVIYSMALTSKHDIYLATGKLFKTNVSGDSWEEIKQGGVKQIAIDDADRLYLLTKQDDHISQLYRSMDNAKTWEHLQSFTGDSHFTLLTDGRITASSDNGLLISDKTQTKFTPLPFTFSTARTSRVFALDKQHLYAIDSERYSHSGQLFRSEDSGRSWSLAYNGKVDGITTFNHKLVIAADSKRILTSDDLGKTWQEMYTFTDDSFVNLSNYAGSILLECYNRTYLSNDLTHWQKINTFAPDDRGINFDYYLQGNAIYFNTGESIKVSTDNGKTWTILLGNIHQDVGLIKGSGATLVAAFPLGGVIKSTDGGQHWELINQGLLDAHFTSLLVLDENYYLIATDQGVFSTKDGGENWVIEKNGLDTLSILSLFANDHMLLAGSNGDGVYKAKLN